MVDDGSDVVVVEDGSDVVVVADVVVVEGAVVVVEDKGVVVVVDDAGVVVVVDTGAVVVVVADPKLINTAVPSLSSVEPTLMIQVFGALLQSKVPDPVLTTDTTSSVVLKSPAALVNTDFERAESAGEPFLPSAIGTVALGGKLVPCTVTV